MYYLHSRYYDPMVGRFINADAFASTGQGILGANMFAYCGNNAVCFRDSSGKEPVEIIDTDGDGVNDCFIYEYSYETVILIDEMGIIDAIHISGQGRIYIYNNVSSSFLNDRRNQPDGFVEGHDFMVGDFTNQSNPNIQVHDSYKCVIPAQMGAIVDVLLEYSNEYAPNWIRSRDSLVTEWIEHNRYSLFSERAKHVDFDNAEEGKGVIYFLWKAVTSIF